MPTLQDPPTATVAKTPAAVRAALVEVREKLREALDLAKGETADPAAASDGDAPSSAA